MQYKPCINADESIKKIDRILSKQKIKKKTLVICPELSLQKYICITKDKKSFNQAIDLKSPIFDEVKKITKKYNIYLCINIFEKNKNNYFNTLVILNTSGEIVLKYNKKNIPSEECYEERYYFKQPSNNYKLFSINGVKIGVLICWDQWHSAPYLFMKKNKVNMIICPTAIGFTEKNNKKINLPNEKEKWCEVIKANSLMINTPILISNRIGKESSKPYSVTFWGSSFITDSNGTIAKKLLKNESVMHYQVYTNHQITSKRLWNFIE